MSTLLAVGSEFDVDKFLAASPIKPLIVYHPGDVWRSTKPGGRRLTRSGFLADVSTKDSDNLSGQIEDAKVFLKDHGAELRRLVAFPGCEYVEIEFTIDLRIGKDIVMQSDTFPADLLLLAGACGVDITVTVQPPFEGPASSRAASGSLD